jgi:hypothetical protein
MATSGTATFNLDLVELVEEAFERAGGEVRSGYDLRTARRSLNLLLADWANRGLNLWTFEEGSVSLVAGTATYALPADTVDIIEHVLRTGSGASQSDMTMTRTSVSTYAAIPNKLATGRPLQLLVTRTATPTVTVWPVPDGGGPYTLRYWRLRRLQDAGTGVQTQDVPFRFLPALVAGLSYHVALKVPGGIDRLPVLEAQYREAFQTAMDEDRERASVRLVPRFAA